MNEELVILINTLRVRTPMYIGYLSILRFSSFLQGYFWAIYCRDKNFEMQTSMGYFTDWLAVKYSIRESLGWDGILLKLAKDDDELALQLFWRHWDEFIELSKNVSPESHTLTYKNMVSYE